MKSSLLGVITYFSDRVIPCGIVTVTVMALFEITFYGVDVHCLVNGYVVLFLFSISKGQSEFWITSFCCSFCLFMIMSLAERP